MKSGTLWSIILEQISKELTKRPVFRVVERLVSKGGGKPPPKNKAAALLK